MGAKILIIDDSEKIRHDVRQALTVAGYEIIEAVDGVDGLEKLRAHSDVALALCDVNMPRMTGLEMLATIFKDAADTRPRTPIMMLTTEGQPSLIRRARECGAKGWIVKPFKAELLLGAVRKLIADAAVTAAVAP
jgi:two-component system chemotaxis response regulator CheY